MRKRVFAIVPAVCFSVCLSGCVSVAPDGIRNARLDFNQAVHETNDEQLLLNVVRVHKYESPIFTSVVERDFQASTSGGLTGGSSTIGAIPAIGILSGTLTVSQSPTDKILVPYGVDLINQYNSSITLGSTIVLYQSNYNLSAIIELVFQNLTSDYINYYRAADLIRALDAFGAIGMINNDDDSLTIYLRPSSDPIHSAVDTCYVSSSINKDVMRYWTELSSMFQVTGGRSIVLRNEIKKRSTAASVSSARNKGAGSQKPTVNLDFRNLVLTRPAIGALRETQQGNEFYFIASSAAKAFFDENRKAIGEDSSHPLITKKEYYYVDSEDSIANLWNQDCSSFSRPASNAASEARRLGHQRVFFVIEMGSQPDPNAFVSTFYRGVWYSVNDDDHVTKDNLALLSTILTIEAQPSSAGATPTVLTPSGH